MEPLDDPHYRLVPHVRSTGPRLLLRWWSHNEQHHVAVVKSVEQAAVVWREALQRDADSRVESFWRATIVLPPKSLEKAWAIRSYRRELRDFKSWMSSLAKDVLDDIGEPPASFTRCVYKAREGFEDVDEECRLDHSFCAKCDGHAVRWNGGSLTDCFREKKDLWRREGWRKHDCEKLHLPFEGAQADPGWPLWAAVGNFGHHSSGVDLVEVWRKGSKCDLFSLNNREVLFFFQGRKIEAPPLFAEMQAEEKAAWEAEKAKRSLAFQADREKERQKTLALAAQLFAPK